jgi:SAM-dependent methyltransferase
MAEPNALTRQFDDAAELYNEVRPRYPEELVEHIIAFASLPPYGRIFEVGCGTGQMTLPFAQRGYAIVAMTKGSGWPCWPPSMVSPIRTSAWWRVPLKPGRTLRGATTCSWPRKRFTGSSRTTA